MTTSRAAEHRTTGRAASPGPAIVLVEPQLGENIGMVARAMANFQLFDLRLVNPRDGWPSPSAKAAASRADHVLDAARLFDTTEAACADLNFVYATTARARDSFKPVRAPDAAADVLRARIGAGEGAGILFGRERYGLSNHEVSLADEIVTFPVDPTFASLNIAQAVLLMSYAWAMADKGRGAAPRFSAPEAAPATKADLYGLLDHLEASLERNGYFHPPHKREALSTKLRTLLTKAGFSEPEVRALRGVVRSFDYAIEHRGAGQPVPIDSDGARRVEDHGTTQRDDER